MRLTSIEFSFDPCRPNVYRDGPRGVGYPLTHVQLAVAILLVNLALSTTTIILFTECCLRTILTFLSHSRLNVIFSLSTYTCFDAVCHHFLNNICIYVIMSYATQA